MATSVAQKMSQSPQQRGVAWERRRELPAQRSDRGGSGWVIAGLVVLGLGVLAWYTLGPDLQRYMKIRNM